MMSSRPKLFSANATIAWASFAFETSAPNALAFAPISLAVASAVSFFTSTTTTFAPSRAKRRHEAFPMPLPPPVISATLFARRMCSPGSQFAVHGWQRLCELPTAIRELRHFEISLPFPVRHDRVELPLLGAEKVQVVIDDILTECRTCPLALGERVNRLSQ